ncbi:MAG: PaaX family transcriptional regulator, partial [Aquamicrobium sp.]|nr:PaaX family transcriptional regulator [Aquamicrobium sp.]
MPEIVNSSNIETPNARRVILNLLRVAEGGVLSAAEAIAACALFGISGNSVRVTLARLSQARLVEAAG